MLNTGKLYVYSKQSLSSLCNRKHMNKCNYESKSEIDLIPLIKCSNEMKPSHGAD